MMASIMMLDRLGEKIRAPIREATDNATGGKDHRAGSTCDSIQIHIWSNKKSDTHREVD